MELLFDVAREGFESGFLITLSSEITFFAMRSFESPELLRAVPFAVAGMMAGLLIDWGIGVALARFSSQGWFPKARYERMAAIARRHGVWLLLLAWTPLGSAIMLAAGVFRLRPLYVVVLTLIGLAGYYGTLALA